MEEMEQAKAIVEIKVVLDKWLEDTEVYCGYFYDGQTHDMAKAAAMVLVGSSRGQEYLRREEIDD